jgi:hypothetical protein
MILLAFDDFGIFLLFLKDNINFILSESVKCQNFDELGIDEDHAGHDVASNDERKAQEIIHDDGCICWIAFSIIIILRRDGIHQRSAGRLPWIQLRHQLNHQHLYDY